MTVMTVDSYDSYDSRIVMILLGRSTVGWSVLIMMIQGITRSGVLGTMWMKMRDIVFPSSRMWLAFFSSSEAVFDINLRTVVADSVVYEPSREMMPVSEGPGLDYNADGEPESVSTVLIPSVLKGSQPDVDDSVCLSPVVVTTFPLQAPPASGPELPRLSVHCPSIGNLPCPAAAGPLLSPTVYSGNTVPLSHCHPVVVRISVYRNTLPTGAYQSGPPECHYQTSYYPVHQAKPDRIFEYPVKAEFIKVPTPCTPMGSSSLSEIFFFLRHLTIYFVFSFSLRLKKIGILRVLSCHCSAVIRHISPFLRQNSILVKGTKM